MLFFDNGRLEWLRNKVRSNLSRMEMKVGQIEVVLGENFVDWDVEEDDNEVD